MDYKFGDLITLGNGEKYTILNVMENNNSKYLYVDTVSDDENDVLYNFKLFEVVENGLIPVTDKNLIDKLLPMISDDILDSTSEDDLNAQFYVVKYNE